MAFTILCGTLFAVLGLLPILLASAQTYQNVTLGSSITANNENTTWKSPSGDFAFGFQEVAPGKYLLAIWFDKIPEKTIVWSANRNHLVEEGSRIQLSRDGVVFQLNDANGQPIWNISNPHDDIVGYGAMLDSGEFVLMGITTNKIMWRTFDHPSDTLLPGQTLERNNSLISSFAKTNYSNGRFRLDMQDDGNLCIYTTNFPMVDADFPLWCYIILDPPHTGDRLIFNESGFVLAPITSTGTYKILLSTGASSDRFYQRAILENDGVFRHYVYPKPITLSSGGVKSWVVLDFFPDNVCESVHDVREVKGFGVCGSNSACSIMATEGRPNCSCINNYSLIDPNDGISGCKPDFVRQSCDIDLNNTNAYHLVDMPNTSWLSAFYRSFDSVDEEWCRQACLTDCFCDVAFYQANNCAKHSLPLIYGKTNSSTEGKSLVKVGNYTTTTTSTNISAPSNLQTKEQQSSVRITGIFLGCFAFLTLLLIPTVIFLACRYKKTKPRFPQSYRVVPGLNIRSFSFSDLHEATNGFSEQLGSGATSIVYKGVLRNENVKQIAVKKLGDISKDAEKEFEAEVNSISRTNHKNLVQLLGYCDEGAQKLLVYEFMSNGSLSSFLFETKKPEWCKRVQIAFAIARGICYLHEECRTQIIHCDIKPQNVLLDESLTAKLSDFGLAKLLRVDQTRTLTGIRGTRGYVAPEWFRNMPITVKVDVYSFGILLLELVCCRRNVNKNVTDVNCDVLAYWAYDCYKEKKLDMLVADEDEVMNDIENFEKFVMTAIWCIQEDPSLRPNMKEVLLMLEGSIEVPNPPNPELFN